MERMRALGLAVVIGVGMTGIRGARAAAQEAPMSFQLTSLAFEEGQAIPPQYTCDADDVSPPLAWTKPPEGTKSFALITDDPDAPMRTWVHWIVYNLPPGTRQLPEGLATDPELSDGTRQGTTDFGRTGYGGPCPPSGTHRYFFTLYALDTLLRLPPGAAKADVERAMQGHVLAEAKLMGTYRRKRR